MSFSALERYGEAHVLPLLCDLLAKGHADRILLSQDVCHDGQLQRYGGHGYTYLAGTFLPRLREAGVSDADIQTMTIANPRRILTID
jgi:phosphotriesterase-related protein